MAKRQRQQSLLSWSCKRARSEDNEVNTDDFPRPQIENLTSDEFSDSTINHGGSEESACEPCTAECCSSIAKVFQPTDKHLLESLATTRKFQSQWYKQFSWLTICMTVGKAFCIYC